MTIVPSTMSDRLMPRLLRALRRVSLLELALYLLLTAIAVVPIVVLVLGSLTAASQGFSGALLAGGVTFANYVALLGSPSFQSALSNTVLTSAAGAIIAMLLGSWLAFLVVRTDIPFKSFTTIVAVVPFFVSAFVHAFAWLVLADPQVGIINMVLAALDWPLRLNIASLGGVAFVQGLYHTPFVFLFVTAALSMVDPSLEEASRMSGAGVWRMVTRVTLPLVMPAILSGGVLVFALMSGNFAIPSLLGTSARLEFITSSIYRMMQFSPPKFGEAATAGVILMLITLALYALQRRYVGRRNYLSVTGKGFRPRVIKLRGLRWICTLSVFVYALVVIVIPLGALLLRSSRPYFYLSQLSDLWNLSLVKWSNYDLLLSYSQVSRALGNTALLSVMTAAIGGVLFFLIAYGAERMSGKGLPLVRYLSTLPAAIPGMVLGLSYLWVALYLPLPLYGTIWVLLVSYLARFTPQGVGSISSSMRSLHPELEEGARVAGAGLWLRLRAIMFPLSRQGILSAMVLCFVLAVTELHTSILLYTARTTVLSVVMYEFWQSGQWGAAAALSIIQSLLVVSVLIIAWKVLGISLYPELGNDNKKSASNQTED